MYSNLTTFRTYNQEKLIINQARRPYSTDFSIKVQKPRAPGSGDFSFKVKNLHRPRAGFREFLIKVKILHFGPRPGVRDLIASACCRLACKSASGLQRSPGPAGRRVADRTARRNCRQNYAICLQINALLFCVLSDFLAGGQYIYPSFSNTPIRPYFTI